MIIKIKNLKLKTIIGVYDWEQNIDRDITINAQITTDCNQSLQSDDLNDAIDYDEIVTKIKNVIAAKRYNLVEKMIQDVMDEIMSDSRLKKCILEIEKVGAVADLESFSVTIEQDNK